MHLVHRETCRICGSTALVPAIDVGSQNLQGAFVKAGAGRVCNRKIPTLLVRCDPEQDENACGLLQMAVSVPPDVLYSSYWYRSGTNNTMTDHLGGVVKTVLSMLDQSPKLVLDIGCNDGTLLNFYPKSVEKVGVDPSDAVKNINDNIHVINDFYPSKAVDKFRNGRGFDVITSIAMFYDLEDPTSFVRSVSEALSLNGIWVFEMSYMPEMLRKNSFDTICHEHLEYYSLAVIEKLLKSCGLILAKIEFNQINGGSIRCYAVHDNAGVALDQKNLDLIADTRLAEFDLKLDTSDPYEKFQSDIEMVRDNLIELVEKINSEGKTIHIYGASTKGNTILQWCGLDKTKIPFAAERNPDKWGAKTLGTNIDIISEDESRKMNPDYYLVLPWHFKEEFIQREKHMIEAGTKFIFPLPSIEVIDIDSLES